MIFEDLWSIVHQQTHAECRRIPAQRKAHYVFGKVYGCLSWCLGMDSLGDAYGLVAEFLSGPVTLGDGTIGESGRGMIGINVAITTLQVEGQRNMIERRFDRACHRSDKVG